MATRRPAAATTPNRPNMTMIDMTNTTDVPRSSNGRSPLEISPGDDCSNFRHSGGRYNDHDADAYDDDHNESQPHRHSERRPLSIEEQYEYQRGEAKISNWKESEFAVGCVEPTWADELESSRLKRVMRRSRRNRANGSDISGGLTGRIKDNIQDFNEGVEECCSGCCQDEIDPSCGCVYLSAVVCSRIGAARIGNMAVLKEKYILVEEEVDDDDEAENVEAIGGDVEKIAGKGKFTKLEGEEVCFHDEESLQHRSANQSVSNNDRKNNTKKTKMVRKREIQLIVGPFWPMLLFITYPLIFTVSFFAAWSGLHGRPLYIKIIWALLTGQLIRSLFNTGFRDPGILRKHKSPPPVESEYDSDDSDVGRRRRRIAFRWGNANGPWRWSDQTQSYRPKSSMYCPDCKVIVEEFDHTCPWTGTAIGKKNMASFQMFVCLVFVCLIMDIFLITDAIPR